MVRERASNRDFPDAHIARLDAIETREATLELFQTTAPLEVDIGCGRGRFLLARARNEPGHNFIGVDRVLLRLRKLDKRAGASGLTNIRLICGDAAELVRERLPGDAVQTFFVFFPDPWPKRRHHGRRLMSRRFASDLWAAMAPDGWLHIATDHADYFASIRSFLDADVRFRSTAPFVPAEEEETDFGLIFRGKGHPLFRCSYRKNRPEA